MIYHSEDGRDKLKWAGLTIKCGIQNQIIKTKSEQEKYTEK